MISPVIETPHVTLYQGDALGILRAMADESVDCVVTSPPYWGLRDYSSDGQLGLERTPEEYVAVMVDVFREVHRVLTKRGTLWLNIGDSYNAYNGNRGPTGSTLEGRRQHMVGRPHVPTGSGKSVSELKNKDMVGIPWRMAFALQADGWYLRADIIWSKPNPMPESVTDRPTKAHEYLFLLAKSDRYYYDAEAIAEAVSENTHMRVSQNLAAQIGSDRANGNTRADRADRPMKAEPGRYILSPKTVEPGSGIKNNTSFTDATALLVSARNSRSVWTIATQGYPDAHFATFPEELPRRAVLAGCPEQVCVTCGKARERVTTIAYEDRGRTTNGPRSQERKHIEHGSAGYGQRLEKSTTTTGWSDCGHGAYRLGVVLDPFAGSGTTLAVARDLGRRGVGIELNPEYVKLIEQRCAQLALEMA